jgi:LmbE family N-acetylglucosaminyl deacetylase
MLPLDLTRSLGPTPRILCLGAHPDDIEIGCGGTLLQLREAIPESRWDWVVLTGNEIRHAEARTSAERFSGKTTAAQLHLQSFRDGYLPYEGARVKDYFESLKGEIEPDLIFTHSSLDGHQDHRLVSDLTWNTWRNHLILEYEIPKYDGDLGQPQAYFGFDRDTAEDKTRIILEVFESQRAKEWFDDDVLLSLMRLRGVECNAPGRYAEAFYARKWSLAAGASD